MAPPPPPPKFVFGVWRTAEYPFSKVMFCTISCGWAWLKQSPVVKRCFGSQVFMYRIWCLPAPLRVTRPPPSRTTRRLVFTTFAVAAMVMITGFGPQLKVMMPPLATALTTAAEVQLADVPCPITRVGWLVFTARPAGGTGTWPFGLPAAGSSCESVWVVAVLPACGLLAVALLAAALAAVAAGLSAAELVVARSLDAATDVTGGCAAVAHAARAMPVVRA